MSISQRLRAAIEKSGKRITVIARESKIHQPMLTRFMQGYDIRLATAERLADYFGLELCPKKGGAKRRA